MGGADRMASTRTSLVLKRVEDPGEQYLAGLTLVAYARRCADGSVDRDDLRSLLVRLGIWDKRSIVLHRGKRLAGRP